MELCKNANFQLYIISLNLNNQTIQKEVIVMSANVETMFYTREKPWHGLGTQVMDAPASAAALALAGLDWKVIQKALLTEDGHPVPGFKARTSHHRNRGKGSSDAPERVPPSAFPSGALKALTAPAFFRLS